jgi:hypothetical protein
VEELTMVGIAEVSDKKRQGLVHDLRDYLEGATTSLQEGGFLCRAQGQPSVMVKLAGEHLLFAFGKNGSLEDLEDVYAGKGARAQQRRRPREDAQFWKGDPSRSCGSTRDVLPTLR